MLGNTNEIQEMLDVDRVEALPVTRPRTPDELWANCVNILITLCENVLLDENMTPIRPSGLGLSGGDSQQQFKQRSESPDHAANLSRDPPQSKRKRDFADTARESKSQRLSDSLANEVARSLTFTEFPPSDIVTARNTGTDDDDEPSFMDVESSSRADASPRGMPIGASSPHTTNNDNNNNSARRFRDVALRRANRSSVRPRHANHTTGPDLHITSTTQPLLIPTLRRMSSSSLSSPYHNPFAQQPSTSLDAWATSQALKRHVDPFAFGRAFEEKTEELRRTLVMLQDGSGRTYEEIKELMETVIRTAEWMSADHDGRFADIFPQWALVESSLENIARYIQIVEDMKQLIMNPFPRTADLATDLRTAHTLLESKCILYGDTILKQNGLGWKVMALPEQDHLIAAVKGWFYSLALGLAGEMNVEVAKARSQGLEESGGGGGLGEKDVGKFMETILSVVELISDHIDFTAFPSSKLTGSATDLATVYIHYTCSQMNRIASSATSSSSTYPSSTHNTRIDVRFMYHLENVCRLLSHLRIIRDAESANPPASHHHYHHNRDANHDMVCLVTAEDLSAALVELGLRTCEVVQTQRQRMVQAARSLAVTGPVGFMYVFEFLLRFVGRVVEFAGREKEEEGRMQRLLSSLEHLEATLPSM